MGKHMSNISRVVILLAAICCASNSLSLAAAETGGLTLHCQGAAQRNDDPTGSDLNIKYFHQEGTILVDFDRRTIEFMDWGVVPLETVADDLIRGKDGAFEFNKDQSGATIYLWRLTGEVYARFWRHDLKQQVTWYPRLFAGTCERVKKKF